MCGYNAYSWYVSFAHRSIRIFYQSECNIGDIAPDPWLLPLGVTGWVGGAPSHAEMVRNDNHRARAMAIQNPPTVLTTPVLG
jgi:hypothetical protein